MNQGVQEVWKPVEGYENYYQISNLGRVRSLPRVKKARGGSTYVFLGRVLKPSPDKDGYLVVGLTGNGRQVKKTVHRLMAEAFIPNPYGHPLVRHLNDKKNDNRIKNLAWGTYSDNQLDSVRNGTHFSANAQKTRCPQGHAYTEENTYVYTLKNGGSGRHCRECVRTRSRDYKRRQKSEPLLTLI